MHTHLLERTQLIPADLATVWDFFSSPRNLDRITPPEVQFRITSDWPDRLAEGQRLTYRVTPLLRLPVTLVTRITVVREHAYFEDIMERGPYRLWCHQHTFTQAGDCVRMDDRVRYALHLDPLSRPIHALLIRPKLHAIFDYRHAVVTDLFGPTAGR